MWTNEGGKCSVVLESDIFTSDSNEKLQVGMEYDVKYGADSFKGFLKMLGLLQFK